MNTVKTIHDDETTHFLQSVTPAERRAAWFYQEKFVPGLFAPWSSQTIAAADIGSGDHVLDIACGSGVVTRDIAAITGADRPPVGLDLSRGMLAVAHSLEPGIDWRLGDACCLPFADAGFDRVVCQFGLMFFADRVTALREMLRVLKPGGRIALVVWDSLSSNPGFADMVEVLARKAGSEAAAALTAPFCLGNRESLYDLAGQAGLRDVDLQTHEGEACFAGMYDFVDTELRGWLPVMNVHLDEATIAAIHEDCESSLNHYRNSHSGELTLPVSAHVVTVTR
jgi:SAM-dependent methyltransferase